MKIICSLIALLVISNYIFKEKCIVSSTTQDFSEWLGTIGMHCLVESLIIPFKVIFKNVRLL
jgi:hypothetical protein